MEDRKVHHQKTMRLCGLVRGRRGHIQNTTPGADSRNRPPIFVGHRGRATGQGARAVGSRRTGTQARDTLQQRPQGAGAKQGLKKSQDSKGLFVVLS